MSFVKTLHLSSRFFGKKKTLESLWEPHQQAVEALPYTVWFAFLFPFIITSWQQEEWLTTFFNVMKIINTQVKTSNMNQRFGVFMTPLSR